MEILLVMFAILVAAVLFCGWVIVCAGRAVMRLVIPKRNPMPIPANVQRCSNRQCSCDNPTYARFCRRCGKSLPNLLRIVTSTAAMW